MADEIEQHMKQVFQKKPKNKILSFKEIFELHSAAQKHRNIRKEAK